MKRRTYTVDVGDLGGRILAGLQSALGTEWAARLTPRDRALIEAVATDAAVVLLLGLSGQAEDARREKAHVDAQLRNVSAAEAAHVSRQLWAAVDRVLRQAVAVALAVA